MHICLLEIENFRGIRNARIRLGQHVVLLGPNNVGKSAVVDALALLFGRKGMVRDLWEHDFFGSSPEAKDRIDLRATITGFPTDDPDRYPQWFSDATHAWWMPDLGKVEFGDRPEHSRLAMQIGFAARFDADLAEVLTERYFVDGDTDPFQDDTRSVRAHHLQELGFFLLPANRTWDRMLSFASDLFRRTLQAEDAKPSHELVQLRDYLRAPAAHLENAEGFKEVVSRVETELSAYIGAAEAKLSFLPTTGDIDGVLRAITPHLVGKGGADSPSVPMGKQGAGVVSLQSLLLLLGVGRRRREHGANFVLAAEEPELHVHPGHHRRLVSRLRGVSDQSIVTTHSPQVAAYYRPGEILVLQNSGGDLTATPLREGATPGKNALLRLYTILRPEVCEALMHSVVIVPEGETEFRWFNGLLRSCVTAEGWDAETDDLLGVTALGVIPTQSSHVVDTYEQLRDVAPKLVPLCDGDSSGKDYVKRLGKLARPPENIARLADDLELEGVIAWVLEPLIDDEAFWSEVTQHSSPVARTRSALIEVLSKNKTLWTFHEALLAHVANSKDSAARARLFLRGLAEVASGKPQTGDWKAVTPAGSVAVWIWDVPK